MGFTDLILFCAKDGGEVIRHDMAEEVLMEIWYCVESTSIHKKAKLLLLDISGAKY